MVSFDGFPALSFATTATATTREGIQKVGGNQNLHQHHHKQGRYKGGKRPQRQTTNDSTFLLSIQQRSKRSNNNNYNNNNTHTYSTYSTNTTIKRQVSKTRRNQPEQPRSTTTTDGLCNGRNFQLRHENEKTKQKNKHKKTATRIIDKHNNVVEYCPGIIFL